MRSVQPLLIGDPESLAAENNPVTNDCEYSGNRYLAGYHISVQSGPEWKPVAAQLVGKRLTYLAHYLLYVVLLCTTCSVRLSLPRYGGELHIVLRRRELETEFDILELLFTVPSDTCYSAGFVSKLLSYYVHDG